MSRFDAVKLPFSEIRRARRADIEVIAADTRAEDVAELWSSGRTTPAECMTFGLRFGDNAWTGTIHDVPVCMFGAVPVSFLGRVGVPWMVGTNALRSPRAQRELLRRSRPALGVMLSRYDVLANVVDERNGSARRWLNWLGFEIAEEAITHGPDRLPFRGFVMRRNS